MSLLLLTLPLLPLPAIETLCFPDAANQTRHCWLRRVASSNWRESRRCFALVPSMPLLPLLPLLWLSFLPSLQTDASLVYLAASLARCRSRRHA